MKKKHGMLLVAAKFCGVDTQALGVTPERMGRIKVKLQMQHDHWPPDLLALMIRIHISRGLKIREISKRLGFTGPDTVLRARRRNGIPFDYEKRIRKIRASNPD